MDINALHQKLIAAARQNPPSDAVPYAFEKRIMARLGAAARPDPWSQWGASLWRAAMGCVAITLLISAVSFIEPPDTVADNQPDDLETTVLAGMNHIGENW